MRRMIWVFLLITVFALPLFAQTFRGAINGVVVDPSGAAVPNATVIAKDSGTGIEHTTVTTGNGQFSFQDLPLGSYLVSVTAAGFPSYKVDKVAVTAGTIYTLSVKLSLQQQATTVEVSAAALALDTTTEAQTTLVTGGDLAAVPLNGRDFTQLIAVTPGFGGYSAGGYGSLNGTRANQINWQIDGVDNNDLWHNIPAVNQGGVSGIAGIVLPIDAIDEFSAQTESSPETGRNPGGTVNLVIKSGTNSIHGGVYYFNRNEAYAASPAFLPDGVAKPKMRNQQWGGSVGGPVWKDHTFFFVAFEKQKFTIGVQSEATEPSTAYQAEATNLLSTYGVSPNPVAQQLLANLWPSYALNGAAAPNNYFSSDPEYGYSYNGIVRLDHKINNNNNISFRWFAGQGNQVAPVGSILKYYYEVAPLHVQNYSLTLNTTISPRLTNQVLIGVNYFNQVFNDFANGFNVSDYGLYLSPSVTFTGAPNIQINGFDEIGLTPPEGRNDITGHLDDIVSFVTGKHQFRFGGEFRQAQLEEFYHRHGLGSFVFDGSQGPWAGTQADNNVASLADFLAGYVDTSTISVGNPVRQVFVNTFNLFAQDAWQVTRKLTINYGIRYDYDGPMHNSTKDLSTFVPSQGGLVLQGTGVSKLYPSDWNNFAPRFGFAYRPHDDGDLVIRGGIGLYYDTVNLNPFLDNRPGNGGPNGVESNPAGASPVSTVEIDTYTLPTDNSYIFPGAGAVCTSGNAAAEPSCANTVYNVFSVNQAFRTPYFYNYNLNIEKGLGHSLLWQIGFVGSQGRKLITLADINQPSLADPSDPLALPKQERRPYFSTFPNFGVINELQTNGDSNYNSLQTTLKVKEWHRVTAQFAYTWAHSLDDMTQYRGALPQDSYNLRGDYGNSDFDTRHNFTALVNYILPPASYGPKWLLDGWELSSLVSLHAGQPFNITTSEDTTGTDEFVQRANLVGDPFAGVSHSIQSASDGTKSVTWVNAAAFAAPTPGTFGTLPRNYLYGPGFASVDFAVFKNTKITERISTQLRIEMFNIFNRANMAPPSGTFGSGGFGIVNDTIGDWNGAPGIGPGEPFNMQLALKLIF